METVLTWLTLVLLAVIVGVLAVYLILIAAALLRANRNLSKLVGGLEAIRDNTAPLAENLPAINQAAVTLREQLQAVDGHLLRIVSLVRK